MFSQWESTMFFFQKMENSKYTILAPASNEGATLGDWYVPVHYKNLKEELLQNTTCRISAIAWDHQFLNAQIHQQTNFPDMTQCSNDRAPEYYNIQTGTKIQLRHLMAMMVYCNFDVCL